MEWIDVFKNVVLVLAGAAVSGLGTWITRRWYLADRKTDREEARRENSLERMRAVYVDLLRVGIDFQALNRGGHADQWQEYTERFRAVKAAAWIYAEEGLRTKFDRYLKLVSETREEEDEKNLEGDWTGVTAAWEEVAAEARAEIARVSGV